MNADPARPGYRHIVFRPQPVADITWAGYESQTPYGPAGVRWDRHADGFTLWVKVPVGSTATVYVPVASGGSVRVNGSDAPDGNAVYKEMEDGYAVYEVRSGEYTFDV